MIAAVSPYGSWKSPISVEVVATGEVGLEQVRLDAGDIYWIERRAQEGGRKVIVRRSRDGVVADVTPVRFNARTRVHEYGGGDYAVADGTVVFSNFTDQGLYLQESQLDPKPLTSTPDMRYADGQIDRRRNRLFSVREDHSSPGEAVNTIASINLDGVNAGTVILSGTDFYSSPRLSPDGSQLAWLTWNHPNMPWDGTELWVGKLSDDGSVTEQEKVAGGVDESIFQPEWSPSGTLYFVSDRTGWWNLYRWQEYKIEPLCPLDAEFGQPQWVFGTSLYAFASEQRIVCTYTKNGHDYLATLDTKTRKLETVELPFTTISQIRAGDARVVFIGASGTEATSIVSLDLVTKSFEVLRRSRETAVDDGYIAAGQSIEFPTAGGLTAHGYFYPPRNRDYAAPAHEKPPLLVMSHGDRPLQPLRRSNIPSNIGPAGVSRCST